jgi:hypothetical protein
MNGEIQKLITDRKYRLSVFIFEQMFARFSGTRKEFADISEAVAYNEETDQQCLEMFAEPLPF